MTVFAESSAVLAWLLGEEQAAEIRRHLALATLVMTSDLTLVECDRVLIRATATREVTEAGAASRRAALTAASAHWTRLRLDAHVLERARRRFPEEPIRTLDALHLASALVAQDAVPDIIMLSVDDRVCSNARALGFDVLPALERLRP